MSKKYKNHPERMEDESNEQVITQGQEQEQEQVDDVEAVEIAIVDELGDFVKDMDEKMQRAKQEEEALDNEFGLTVNLREKVFQREVTKLVAMLRDRYVGGDEKSGGSITELIVTGSGLVVHFSDGTHMVLSGKWTERYEKVTGEESPKGASAHASLRSWAKKMGVPYRVQ